MSLHYFTSCENRAQMGSCDCWEIWSESIIKVMAIPTYLRSGDHRYISDVSTVSGSFAPQIKQIGYY